MLRAWLLVIFVIAAVSFIKRWMLRIAYGRKFKGSKKGKERGQLNKAPGRTVRGPKGQ